MLLDSAGSASIPRQRQAVETRPRSGWRSRGADRTVAAGSPGGVSSGFVAVRWTLTTPEGRRVVLQLRQHFQRFTGPGVSGRLVGERIDFTVTERVNGRRVTRRFSGRVTGAGMSGSVAGGGAWRAVKVPPGPPR